MDTNWIISPSTWSSSRPFLVSKQCSLSYFDTVFVVAEWVDYYRSNGIKKNQRITLGTMTDLELILTLLALWSIGATAVLCHHRLSIRSQVKHHQTLQSSQFITSATSDSSAITPPSNVTPDYSRAHPSFQIHPHHIAVLIGTSGSTGEPKLAALTIHQFMTSAQSVCSYFSLSASDRWQLCLPLYHVSGLSIMFRCIQAKCSIILDTKPTSENLHTHGITHSSLVGTQLKELVADNTPAPKFLKALLVGGGAVDPSLKTQAIRLNYPTYISYGMTECASTIAIQAPEKTTFCSLPHIDYKQDQDQLHIKSPSMMSGYWNYSSQTVWKPLTIDGWFNTGDCINTIDSEFTINKRAGDIINSGGEKIHIPTLKTHLKKHFKKHSFKVIPIDDERFGQHYQLVASIKDGSIKENDIIEIIKDELPTYYLPKKITLET